MPPAFDIAQTDKLLTTTRSVRKRLDLAQPVDRGVVLECLRVALQAPSGGNTQPWRWLLVDDPELRAGLGALYKRSHDPYAQGRRAALEEAGGTTATAERVMSSSQHLSDHMGEVPLLVIPCLLGRLPESASVGETAGFYGSILPGVWSFMLALRSRGLGSALTTLHLTYEREAAQLLGIPDTVTQAAMIPVAHVTGEDFRPAERRPIEEVAYLNGWRQPV